MYNLAFAITRTCRSAPDGSMMLPPWPCSGWLRTGTSLQLAATKDGLLNAAKKTPEGERGSLEVWTHWTYDAGRPSNKGRAAALAAAERARREREAADAAAQPEEEEEDKWWEREKGSPFATATLKGLPNRLNFVVLEAAVRPHAADVLVPNVAASADPYCRVSPGDYVFGRAAKESEIPNFKGSFLGRFPLVSADFWTSDHLSERSRSVDAFFQNARARNTHVEATLNHPCPALSPAARRSRGTRTTPTAPRGRRARRRRGGRARGAAGARRTTARPCAAAGPARRG